MTFIAFTQSAACVEAKLILGVQPPTCKSTATPPVTMKITVYPPKPPTFNSNLHDQTATVGKELGFHVSATQPSGKEVSNIIASQTPGLPYPPRANFDVLNKQFYWTPQPADAGKIYSVRFQATNGGLQDKPAILDIKISVLTAKKPTLTSLQNRTAVVGKTETFEVTGYREDGSKVSNYKAQFLNAPQYGFITSTTDRAGHTYEYSSGPGSQSNNTGIFKWKAFYPDAGKKFTLQLSASDAGQDDPNLTASETVEVTVAPVNPPTFRPMPDATIYVGSAGTWEPNAWNEDGTKISQYAMEILGPPYPATQTEPSKHMQQNKDSIFKIIAVPEDAGKEYKLRFYAWADPYCNVTVKDSCVASQVATLDTKFKVLAFSKKPVFEPVRDQTVVAGKKVSFDVVARNEDRTIVQGVTFSGPPDLEFPTGLTRNPQTKSYEWQTRADTARKDYGVRFMACNTSGCETKDMKITVVDSTSPPRFLSGTKKQLECSVGNTLIFDVQAEDPDGGMPPYLKIKNDEKRLFSANNPPVPATVPSDRQAVTAMRYTWTPHSDQVGAYKVTFEAKDDESQTAEYELTITVRANLPPVISPVPDQVITAGKTLVFDVTASGANPDSTTMPVLTMTQFPAGADFTKNESSWAGKFSWTPKTDEVGEYTATFSATDGGGTSTLKVKISAVMELAINQGPAPTGPVSLSQPRRSDVVVQQVQNITPTMSTGPVQSTASVVTPVLDIKPTANIASTTTPAPVVVPATVSAPDAIATPEPTTQLASEPTPQQPAAEETPAPPAPVIAPDIAAEFTNSCTVNGHTRTPAEAAKSMEGVWNSRMWNTVYAKANGNRIEGTFTGNQGRFIATVGADCNIEGRWATHMILAGVDETGTFKIKTAPDSLGDFFGLETDDANPKVISTGWTWRHFGPNETPEPDWYPRMLNPGLTVKKGNQQAVCPNSNPCTGEQMARLAQGYVGSWDTNSGDMVISSASGTAIQGTLSQGGSTGKITGTIQPDGSLKGRWAVSEYAHGKFIFWIDPTGSHFTGNYDDDEMPDVWNEGWSGEKKA